MKLRLKKSYTFKMQLFFLLRPRGIMLQTKKHTYRLQWYGAKGFMLSMDHFNYTKY